MEGRRVVSEAWIDEITSWGPLDQQVRHGTPPPPGTGALCDLSDVGYKCYIWHLKADGAQNKRLLYQLVLQTVTSPRWARDKHRKR